MKRFSVILFGFFLVFFFFPFRTFAAGPAGIDDDLGIWLSADSGAKVSGGAEATNGETVTSWEDQSDADRNASGTGAVYQTTGLNFNPTLYFTDDNYTASDTGLAAGSSGRSIFVVASVNATGWRYVFGQGTVGTGLGAFDFGHRNTGSEEVFITSHSSQEAYQASWSWLPHGAARLAYGDVQGGEMYLAVNGAAPVRQQNSASTLNTVLDGALNIGCRSAGNECWNGNISEIIFYNRVVTSTERQRINSYLALKYGFSLDQSTAQSYLASGSNLMWDKDATDASTYDNGLFGIGRDDSSNLAQVKSRGQTATNVIILQADDEGNNGDPDWNDIADLEFLVIGDNGGAASWTTTGAPTGYSILSKQWKKQEQGNVGSVTMDFDVADSDFNIPAALDGDNYYFIYDTDNDGSLADETPLSMSDEGSNLWRTTVDFGSGGIFTLASTENPAIESLSPADNATSVSVSSNLMITFNKNVTAGAGSITIKKSSDDSVFETIAANGAKVTGGGTSTITINPAGTFSGSTGYYVQIDSNAFEDGSSNFFGGISTTEAWNFTTEAVATPTPTPTSSSNTNSNSSAVLSTTTSSSCTATAPVSAPDLFQVSTSPTTATLYFTPVNPATGYIIMYGTTAGADQHSASFDYTNGGGAVSYTLNSLNPGTTYYFKIQAKNGCATGNWSQILSQRTTGGTSTGTTSRNSISPTPTPKPRGEIIVTNKEQTENPKPTTIQDLSMETGQLGEGYDVEIFVQKDGKPVAGATVELHSIPRRTATDKDGIARFANVEGGDHTVYMEYEGYRGEEQITLTSENKRVTVNLTIEVNPYFNWTIIGWAGIFVFALLVGWFIFFIKRRKKRKNDKTQNLSGDGKHAVSTGQIVRFS